MRDKKTIRKVIATLVFYVSLAIVGSLIFTAIYPLSYRDSISKYAEKYNIDPFLVAAIINVESSYDKNATSSKRARGLMQIGEQTGQWASQELKIDNYSEDTLYDPEMNIQIGVWYLDNLSGEFKGDLDLILAAYNGGSGNVSKWLKMEEHSKDGKTLYNIPFKETENYLKKVKNNYKIYKYIYKNHMYKFDTWDSIYIDLLNRIKNYIKSI